MLENHQPSENLLLSFHHAGVLTLTYIDFESLTHGEFPWRLLKLVLGQGMLQPMPVAPPTKHGPLLGETF